MKQYNYLVAFSCQGGGIGRTHITRTSKLDSFEKLTELAEWIGSNSNFENIAIINFQLVSISRVKKEKNNDKKSD